MPESFREALIGFFKRVQGGAIFMAAIMWAIIVLTYNSSDQSFNTVSSYATTHNWLGAFGSHAADLAWQTVGLSSLLLTVVLASWGWVVWTGRSLDHLPWRMTALIVAIFAGAFGLSAIQNFMSSEHAIRWGGAIGSLLAEWATKRLPGNNGALILSPLMILISLGGVYMAAALMLEEWHDFVALLHDVACRAFHHVSRSVRHVWQKWRHEPDDMFEDEDEENEAAETSKSAAKARDEKTTPVQTKRSRTTLIQRPAASARQAKLALRPEGSMPLPPLELLQWPESAQNSRNEISEEALEKNARLLETVLEDFGVYGHITKVSPGPVVTLYELEPSPGTRSSRVISLADDIARNMSAASVRVAVVPGRNVIGIELPNRKREIVYLRELLSSDTYTDYSGALPLVLGKDIAGASIITDLSRMPHLLIAGTTGSGKSVAINTMILSLIYRLPPEKCRFIMIDPKMLELSVYDGIPHLLTPVVTDPKKAVVALKWAVREMENRYRAMSKLGVRNIEGYNAKVLEITKAGQESTRRVQIGFDEATGEPLFEEQPLNLDPLPFIVVIVDEMADLMLVAGKEIEAAIQRLAQMARAAGIHLIMATQRPSVDVITGTIKANFPTRISFMVTSKIDSRTILGESGAEQLLGQGDMLYMAGGGRLTRVHGPFVSDGEVEQVVGFLKRTGQPHYIDGITEDEEDAGEFGAGEDGEGAGGADDPLFDQAVALVARERKASTSFIQRHLQIGYNRAARLIDLMEAQGMVSPANHVGKREVLLPENR